MFFSTRCLVLCLALLPLTFAFLSTRHQSITRPILKTSKTIDRPNFLGDERCRCRLSTPSDVTIDERESLLQELIQLLESTPANAPTSREFTNSILEVVRKLESDCPTPENDVVDKLGGTWELLWTTQDTSSEQYNSLGPFLNWIK
jgi:PAP_fibrillin